MNFCVAILILKIKENKQHFQHIMLYYFMKGKNTIEVQKRNCSVCGKGSVTDWKCHRWFVKARAGGFSLDDAPQSGRAAEVDSDQFETLIESSQR